MGLELQYAENKELERKLQVQTQSQVSSKDQKWAKEQSKAAGDDSSDTDSDPGRAQKLNI